MKKILIFGCSYSAGSWEPYASKEEQQQKQGTLVKFSSIDKLIDNSRGWYHYVDYFKDKDITVIAISGDGYFTWYQLLLMLDSSNKLNYDEIWIQETVEPRISFFDTKKLELEWNHPRNLKEIDNIKVFNDWTYGNDLQIRHTQFATPDNIEKSHLFNDIFFSNIILKITELFQEFCSKKDIKGYVFSTYEPTMICNYFTRLPIPPSLIRLVQTFLIDNFSLDRKETFDGHLSEKGNKHMGELINKALCIDIKI